MLLGNGQPSLCSPGLDLIYRSRATVPHSLPSPEMVPCKLMSIQDREWQIEQTEILMIYDSSVFKAEMCFEDIEALLVEARNVNLSMRDEISYAIQELCARKPTRRAVFSIITGMSSPKQSLHIYPNLL